MGGIPFFRSMIKTRDGNIGIAATRRRPALRAVALFLLAGGIVGCSEDGGTGPPPPPPQNRAPSASITAPNAGAIFDLGEPVAFTGSGTDPEDGVLSGDALAWSSSVDGQIGTGNAFGRSDLTAGDHTITLTASDAAGLTGQATVTITISEGPLPDLRPGVISVLPSPPRATATVTFEASISNLGTQATSGPIPWRLSVDGVVLATGQTPSLAPGVTSEPIVIADQGPFGAGLHDVLLTIDPDNVIEELDELNNDRSLSVNFVAGPTADLVASAITVGPDGATEDDVLTVSGEITNAGDAATGESFSWALLVDDVEEATGDAPALEPGQTFNLPAQSLGPLAARAHLVELRVDVDSEIAEPNEADNIAAIGFSVLGSAFDIELRFVLPGSVSQTRAFTEAANRWTSLITGDVEDFALNTNGEGCHEPVDQVVDDLIIYVELNRIDGPGGVLGQAGPCFLRDDGLLTLTGIMRFDVKDLESLETQGLLEAVILHEMGHVLGVGTLWDDFGLIFGAGTPNVLFTGARAGEAFSSIGGSGFGGAVPVENQGGPGTRDGHWRESVFGNELMTGFIDAGFNPLSIVTVEQFADLSYEVDASGADPFVLGGPATSAAPSGAAAVLDLSGDVRLGPVYSVDRAGRIRPLSSAR